MSETDNDKAVPEKFERERERERELPEPYLVGDIYEDGLSDSVHTDGQMDSQRASSEDSIASQLPCSLPPRTSVIEPPEGLHPVLLTGIVVNYISSGYVLLPWAFAQGGTLLSSIVLALTALQSYMTATFILEACARAEALRNVEASHHGLPRRYSMAIRQRIHEISELCRLFLDKRLQIFFTATAAFDIYGITWAMAAIFGRTMSDELPMTGQESDYQYYLLIFAAITIPLTCVPVIDQLWTQLCFMVARTIMVLLMISTVAVGYTSNVPQFGVQIGPEKNVPFADFSNMIVMIQICVFSTAFQFAVPGLSGVSRNKKVMLEVFGSAVSYVFVTLVILCLMLAIIFGPQNIDKSSNINWIDYHGGTWDGTGDLRRAPWASFIANYIVLFAAIDGLAVFPLCAVSLGDILLYAFYGEMAHEYRHDWRRRTAFRLLASIPQTIGAMFVNDLSVIATYAGIFTLLSYTMCPSLLAIKSHECMKQEGLPTRTFYNTPFSSNVWAWGLCVLSSLLVIGVIVDSVIPR